MYKVTGVSLNFVFLSLYFQKHLGAPIPPRSQAISWSSHARRCHGTIYKPPLPLLWESVGLVLFPDPESETPRVQHLGRVWFAMWELAWTIDIMLIAHESINFSGVLPATDIMLAAWNGLWLDGLFTPRKLANTTSQAVLVVVSFRGWFVLHLLAVLLLSFLCCVQSPGASTLLTSIVTTTRHKFIQ